VLYKSKNRNKKKGGGTPPPPSNNVGNEGRRVRGRNFGEVAPLNAY